MKLKCLNWLGVPLLLSVITPLVAQSPVATFAENRSFAPVPFGPGERMTYKVTLGFVGDVGKGYMEVTDIDSVHGQPAYRLHMRIEGGIPLARVEDDYQSWLDTRDLFSRRFHTDVHEVRYKRKRAIDFFPAERRWRRTDKDESGPMPTDQPLDDLSFVYFLRTLPLKVGDTYTLPRYFKDEGNPVTVKVLRREKVTVPVGTFNTIVVQPIIKTKGLFGDGGKAEVYVTDDDRRIPVQITTQVKVLKSLNLYLQSYTPGQRVSPPFTPRSTDGQ